MKTRKIASMAAALALCLAPAACSMGSDSTQSSGTTSARTNPFSSGKEASSSSPTPSEIPSAEEIVSKAQKRARAYTWVAISANGTMEGEPMKMNMVGAADKETPMKATIDFDNGGHGEVRRIDSVVYVKGNKQFFKTVTSTKGQSAPPDSTLDLVANKWLKGRSEEVNVGDSFSVKSMVSGMSEESIDTGGMTVTQKSST